MRRILRAIGRGATGKAAFSSVLLYGLFAGYVSWYAFFGTVRSTTEVKWSAPYITYPGPEISQSYFRKKIYLPEQIRQGWLKVMAPDSFGIYVSGKFHGQMRKLDTNPTQYYDITSDLHRGTNVIAVSVHRNTYPGTAKVVVEGEYEDWHGVVTRIASDESWKVYPYEDWLFGDGPEWFEETFNDTHWGNAALAGWPERADHSTMSQNPTVYTEPRRGQWMWSADMAAPRVYLRHRFDLATRPEDGWVRVNGEGYEFLVNGVSLGGNERLIGTYGEEGRPEDNLDVYDVSQFLRAGSNTIAVKGLADRTDRGVYVDGWVRDRGGAVHRIASPEGWEVSTRPAEGWTGSKDDGEGWGPARVRTLLTGESQLAMQTKIPEPPNSHVLAVSARIVAWLILSAIVALALWILLGWIIARWKDVAPETGLGLAAIPYAAPLFSLVLAWFLGTDYRFDEALVYQPWIFWGHLALFVPGLIALAISRIPGKPDARGVSPRLATVTAMLTLLVLMAGGLAMRLQNLDRKPLGGDEVTMSIASRHVLDHGYPAAEVSPHLEERIATTSEIVPYFFAASMAAFPTKSPEFRLRFAPVVFGFATLIMIYVFANLLFGRPTALLATALYTAMPVAINMAQFGRYPQIVQFFALVSAYFWYKAFRDEKLDHKALFWGTIAVVLCYLSWEGVAFYFIAIGLGCVVLRGWDFRWLKDKYLWLAVIVLVLVAYFQLGYRFHITRPIPLIGTGIMDLMPTDRWNQPLYDPIVFVNNYLSMLGLLVPSIVATMGILLMFRNKKLAYCLCLLFVPLLLTTNLIEVQDYRHVYYTMSFIVISAAVVLMAALRHLWPDKERSSLLSPISVWGFASAAAFVGLLTISTTSGVLKTYNFPGVSVTPPTLLACGDEGGIREVAELLKSKSLPDDKVIAYLPHMVYFYCGKVNLYLQSPLHIPVVEAKDGPYAVHRMTGSSLVSSVSEWKDMLSKNHRIWFVLPSKFTLATFDLFQQPEVYDDLKGHLSLLLEDENAWVYLWER